MHITLIRHGMTRGNREKRYIGATNEAVCPEGLALLKNCPVDGTLDKVYVSAMVRTQQTAGILFPNAQQLQIPGLKEMDFGRFEGRNYKDLQADADYRHWVDGKCQGACPGGESRQAFLARTSAAFLPLVEGAIAQNYARLVLVCHGGTIMAVGSLFARPVRDYFQWQVGNGAAVGFNLDEKEWPNGRFLAWED